VVEQDLRMINGAWVLYAPVTYTSMGVTGAKYDLCSTAKCPWWRHGAAM